MPPHIAATGLGRELFLERRRQRLRQRDVARELGVSVWSVMGWERGWSAPGPQMAKRVERYLDGDGNGISETYADLS